MIQRICIVQLEHVCKIEEWKQKGKATPHPRPKSINCDVHVVAFTQSSKSVQASLLVVKLPELDYTYEADVPCELSSEHSIYNTVRPDNNDPSLCGCYEVV